MTKVSNIMTKHDKPNVMTTVGEYKRQNNYQGLYKTTDDEDYDIVISPF